MRLFKKSDEETLPELPGMPKLPELPELPEETKPQKAVLPTLPELPSLPKNRFGEEMNMQAIKSSINSDKKAIEISDKEEISENIGLNERHRTIIKEPVFVKIDRFQDAVRKFEEIKKKFEEIEEALLNIKELKEREDEELKAWEQETEMIKEKIDNIDNSLFNKISLE